MSPVSSTDRLQALQNETLEAIASGEALVAIMERLCAKVQDITPGAICSVVAVDAEGTLRTLAAPGLPSQYSQAIDGTPVGPCTGSCGTAAYLGQAVTVVDIATDALWAGFRHLILPLGFQACWSSPIRARDGRIIGTFAFYYRDKRGPDAVERQIVLTCVHLCAIAIEHEEVRLRNHRLAYFDTLTGLPNRVQFNEAIDRLTSVRGSSFGLMLIDIDHLKVVNDMMGHAVGDALIAAVGVRLKEVVADGMACRIGGDEFAVLLPKCHLAGRLRAAAQAILAAMAQPLDHDGHSLIPSVTIGGVLAGEDGDQVTTLRQNADFALYHAKETRRGGYVRFRNGLRTSITRRVQTVRNVDEALSAGRIFPHYQPVMRIDTNEVVGVEALARMRLPDGTIVTAGAFQEALRDPKLAYRVTGQMLAAIAADIAAWRRADIHFQHVGLNVTSIDFQKGDLVQRIARAFDRAQAPMNHLVIEITEQVFMGGAKDGVARTIEGLRERGMPIALDDFGTGFASLTHLLDFPVDVIKIDRSFVAGLQSGARSGVIVEALVAIADRLGMKIIAEGIEYQAQAERLTSIGCRLGQGYLYSQAVPAAVMTEMLRHYGQRRATDDRRVNDQPKEALVASAA